MRRLLVACALLSVLGGCNPDPPSIIGTWAGSDSKQYVSFTFQADSTFSETINASGFISNYTGTYDRGAVLLKLSYSTGSVTQCDYSFSSLNGTPELILVFANTTLFLLRQ